jgi:hypothetical protein
MSSRPVIVTYDTDAQTYITAVEAAGRTLTLAEKGYINTLVVNGKGNGWWTKMYDGGLLMWGTSSPSRVTFKGVSTLTDTVAPTYSSSGAAFDGATTYITTNINPSTALTIDDTHLAIYVETAPETGIHRDIGSATSGANHFSLSSRSTGVASVVMYRDNGSTGQVGSGNATAGFFIGSRTSNTLLTLYKNGGSIGIPLTASNPNLTLPNVAMFIGALSTSGTAGSFSARTYSFWSVGSGLTSTEVSNMSNDVNSFMTSMGINVY